MAFGLLIVLQVAFRSAEEAFGSRMQVREVRARPHRMWRSWRLSDATTSGASLEDPARAAHELIGVSPTRLSAYILAVIWAAAVIVIRPNGSEGTLACAAAVTAWLCVRAAVALRAPRGGSALRAFSQQHSSSEARRLRESKHDAGLHARGAALRYGTACFGLMAVLAATYLARVFIEPSVLMAAYALAGARIGILATQIRYDAPKASSAAAPPALETASSGRLIAVGPAHVAFEDVRFWDARTRERLDGVSLEFEPGAITAVIGIAGSGRRALSRLASGEGLAQSGRVLIDGLRLEPRWQGAWKALCARVPAATLILRDTLAANLRRSAPRASEHELWAALEAVALGPWARERGLGFVLEASHARLTPGEARRLSLARALLRSPRLLMLEPPEQAIDEADAQAIERCLLSLRELCSVVVLAPTASASAIADHAILLEHGRIVETGRVDALLADPRSRLASLWART